MSSESTRYSEWDVYKADQITELDRKHGESSFIDGSSELDIRQLLHAAGLRSTRCRLALGDLMFGAHFRHLTAEMLFEEASKANVPLSLATIYNTLNLFSQVGLLRRVSIDGRKTYFDTNVTEHQHFYLEETHELVDITGSGLVVRDALDIPDGYEISRVDIVIRITR
jgi:Fur family iron response transcriptional regulator